MRNDEDEQGTHFVVAGHGVEDKMGEASGAGGRK